MIDGVKITPLKQILDERGKVMHMMKNSDPIFSQHADTERSVLRSISPRRHPFGERRGLPPRHRGLCGGTTTRADSPGVATRLPRSGGRRRVPVLG